MRPNSVHDAVSSDGIEQVRRLARSFLRDALADRRAGKLTDGHQDDVRRICKAARELALHAEDMLIILKDSWRSLSETKDLRQEDREAMLGEIVARSISEFYRDD